MKKKIMLICLVCGLLILLTMTAFCVKQSELLNSYKTGFNMNGTYQNSSEEYIVVEQDSSSFYKYKQFEHVAPFQLKESDHPNLYRVGNTPSEMILFDKDCLYFVKADSVEKYTKISNISTFINTNK